MKLHALVLGAGIASILSGVGEASAQESDLGLAVGDTVEFPIEGDEFSGAWIGTVHEVKNARRSSKHPRSKGTGSTVSRLTRHLIRAIFTRRMRRGKPSKR